MNFTRDGIPTHANIHQAWEHKKRGVMTKRCKVSSIVAGRRQDKTLEVGEEVWVLLYISAGVFRPLYIVSNKRIGMHVSVPYTAVKILKEV